MQRKTKKTCSCLQQKQSVRPNTEDDDYKRIKVTALSGKPLHNLQTFTRLWWRSLFTVELIAGDQFKRWMLACNRFLKSPMKFAYIMLSGRSFQSRIVRLKNAKRYLSDLECSSIWWQPASSDLRVELWGWRSLSTGIAERLLTALWNNERRLFSDKM